MTIYEFVRKRRKELGLTQKELADKADVSLSVVKRFEGIKAYNPRGKHFIKIAKALEADTTFMLMDLDWKLFKKKKLDKAQFQNETK